MIVTTLGQGQFDLIQDGHEEETAHGGQTGQRRPWQTHEGGRQDETCVASPNGNACQGSLTIDTMIHVLTFPIKEFVAVDGRWRQGLTLPRTCIGPYPFPHRRNAAIWRSE